MNAPRNGLIRRRLDTHFLTDIGVAVATPEPQNWYNDQDDYGPLAILGWSWPQHNVLDTGHRIIVPYCPEVIDSQTTDMDAANLNAYLLMVEYVVDLHISLWDEVFDEEVRHQMVMREVLRETPPLHRLLHDALAMATLRQAFPTDMFPEDPFDG